MDLFPRCHRDGGTVIELDGLRRVRIRRLDLRDAIRHILIERPDAHLGVVEHVPRVGAAVLQRLHVVLDADDGVGHPLQTHRIRRRRTRLDQASDLRPDRIHQFDRAALAQHQQTGGDAAQQLRYVIQALRRKFARLLYRDGDGFLDTRQIDDAFAQHCLADQTELVILPRARIRCRRRRGRQNEAHQLIVEAVLDRQQNTRDLHQRRFRRRLAVADDLRQIRDFLLHALA
jgi:hypothetical protein